MLPDMLDYIEHIRKRPVWQPIPNEERGRYGKAVPRLPAEFAAVHEEFMQNILPHAAGNVHPAFMGWVHGGGTPVGMLRPCGRRLFTCLKQPAILMLVVPDAVIHVPDTVVKVNCDVICP